MSESANATDRRYTVVQLLVVLTMIAVAVAAIRTGGGAILLGVPTLLAILGGAIGFVIRGRPGFVLGIGCSLVIWFWFFMLAGAFLLPY